MKMLRKCRKIVSIIILLPLAYACGSQPTGADNGVGPATSQVAFKKLTEEQTKDVCQWISPEKIKPLFGVENATFTAPRSAGGLTFQCDQMGALPKGGVQVSFHLKPFDTEEIYETSLEAAKTFVEFQKAKVVPLGVLATITHNSLPANNQITSLLQIHGSGYALDVSAQYQGPLKEADIERALIDIARAFVEKNP